MVEEKTYGRKIVRNSSATRKKVNAKRALLMILGISFLIGCLLGSIITGVAVHNHDKKVAETLSEAETAVIQAVYGAGDNRLVVSELEWTSSNSYNFVELDIPLDADVQEFIYCLSTAYNIDYSLVIAMIDCESSFRTNVVSDTHDYGLMQINQSNHEWLAETLDVSDFLDAKQNVRSGLFVLSNLFDKYGDDPHKVLMAYNLGEAGANRYWKQGIFSTAYTEKIMEKQVVYQNEINERIGGNNDN